MQAFGDLAIAYSDAEASNIGSDRAYLPTFSDELVTSSTFGAPLSVRHE